MAGVDPYSFLTHPQAQHIHNLHRVLRCGEVAMVFLEDKSYSFILEPAQGLCVAEVPEEPFHEFLSSWICLAKGTDAFE